MSGRTDKDLAMWTSKLLNRIWMVYAYNCKHISGKRKENDV